MESASLQWKKMERQRNYLEASEELRNSQLFIWFVMCILLTSILLYKYKLMLKKNNTKKQTKQKQTKIL